jgi:hypothetical protein
MVDTVKHLLVWDDRLVKDSAKTLPCVCCGRACRFTLVDMFNVLMRVETFNVVCGECAQQRFGNEFMVKCAWMPRGR